MGKKGLDYSLNCKVSKAVYDTMQMIASSRGVTVQKMLSHLCYDFCNEEVEKIKHGGSKIHKQ